MPRDGMPASKDFPVYAVYAKPPDGAKIVEGIEKDEQISLLFTSGNDDIGTSASLAIQSQGDRRVWEFHVEKRWAPRK